MQETVCRTRLLMQEEKGEEIKKIVEKWLIRVDKKIEEAVKLIEYEEKAKRSCSKGLSPNFQESLSTWQESNICSEGSHWSQGRS